MSPETQAKQHSTENEQGDLVDRFLKLPPLWKFAGSAVLILLVYLVAEDFIWPTVDDWRKEADRIELLLDESAVIQKRVDRKLKGIVTSLGPIDVPRSPNLGAERLEATVNDIVQGQSVQGYTLKTRPGSRVQASASLRSIAGGGKVERVLAEVEFVSKPEFAVEIVRELEAEPGIESIDELRLTRIEDSGTVEVKLVVEAWVTGIDRRGSS